MATERLYLKDSYLKENRAKIVAIDDNKIILDRTVIHPHSSGLVSDTGYIEINGSRYDIVDALDDRDSDSIIHILDRKPDASIGDEATVHLNWDRRYKLMKLHTASHILASIIYKRYNALITGGEIYEDYARDDYNISKSGEELRAALASAIEEANGIISKGIQLKIYFMKRDEAMKIDGIVKLMEKMPPSQEIWRIVEIPDIDIQADGGPHVNNTNEIGKIKLLKIENRGKDKKRIYFSLDNQ
ncbi:MAG: alanyl-tRNA editing protein AlaX-M [Candidatus Micrarchaeota archaeon]|nr:MAG: alanyl-tRNA editing protein AlaX-M [Candidatus Micrarchaeota archaeon]